MQQVVVQAQRFGRGWELSCPSYPTVTGRCRRLDQVKAVVRSDIAEAAQIPYSQVEVEVQPVLDHEVMEAITQAKRQQAEAKEHVAEANMQYQRQVHRLISSGLTMRDIAHLMGISHQRVGQLAHHR